MARPRTISDEQILATMREMALAYGPAVPLERVAERLSVSAPALLKRFGTRRALLIAALRPAGRPPWLERLARGPTDAPLERQLRDLLDDAADDLADVLPRLMVLRESGIPIEEIFPGEKPPELALAALRSWLQRARRRGLVTVPETEAAAIALLGAVKARAMLAHLRSTPDAAPSADGRHAELARLFARALAPT